MGLQGLHSVMRGAVQKWAVLFVLFDIFERRYDMWFFTSEGFVSVVAHSEKPDTLLVRARDEGSLLSLVEATGAPLRQTPSNDYGYRIEVPKQALVEWL